MCVLCGQLWVEDHWSDNAADGAVGDVVALETHAARRGQRLRNRAARSRLFNRILATRGLSLHDWEGSSYILRDSKGRSAVVANLAQVWQEVAAMTGSPLDPLDPHLLDLVRAQSSR